MFHLSQRKWSVSRDASAKDSAVMKMMEIVYKSNAVTLKKKKITSKVLNALNGLGTFLILHRSKSV